MQTFVHRRALAGISLILDLMPALFPNQMLPQGNTHEV